MPLELQMSANIPAYLEDDRKEWLTIFFCSLNSAFFFFSISKIQSYGLYKMFTKSKSEQVKQIYNPQQSVKWGTI